MHWSILPISFRIIVNLQRYETVVSLASCKQSTWMFQRIVAVTLGIGDADLPGRQFALEGKSRTTNSIRQRWRRGMWSALKVIWFAEAAVHILDLGHNKFELHFHSLTNNEFGRKLLGHTYIRCTAFHSMPCLALCLCCVMLCYIISCDVMAYHIILQ